MGMSARSAERKPSPLFELVCVAGSCGTGRTGLFLRKGYARAREGARRQHLPIKSLVLFEAKGAGVFLRPAALHQKCRLPSGSLCAKLIYAGIYRCSNEKPIDLFLRGGIRLIIGVSLRLCSHQSNRYAEPLCHRPTVILENAHVNGRTACQ